MDAEQAERRVVGSRIAGVVQTMKVAMVLKILAGLVALYGMLIVAGIAVQRRFLYAVEPTYVSPGDAGLTAVEELHVAAPDGTHVRAWYGKARPGQPTLLYFHGNGGSLAARKPRIERFMGEGWGVFMMTYRGYGGSTGSPSERANIADAVRAFDRLASLGVPLRDIVLYGESLGTGVASQVALQRKAAGLILDAPFTSVPDVGAQRFWYLPVHLIMRDRYDTRRVIDKIDTPLLIMHGALDATVPVDMGRTLMQRAHEPKTLAVLPRGGHSDLYIDGNEGLSVVRSFIAGLKR